MTLPSWTPPERPSELTEQRLIEAILNGVFPANSNLPGERELAERLGITCPTLRTVLQRLARDGWIEIRQGKPTRVCDYWQEGTLAVLVGIALHSQQVPPDFVANLLDVRILLAPEYTRLAVKKNAEQIVSLLSDLAFLGDSPAEFAIFDWRLHRSLAIWSGNPVYTLFINSVQRLYEIAGMDYFSRAERRAHSLAFYEELRDLAAAHKPDLAAKLSERVMKESKTCWVE